MDGFGPVNRACMQVCLSYPFLLINQPNHPVVICSIRICMYLRELCFARQTKPATTWRLATTGGQTWASSTRKAASSAAACSIKTLQGCTRTQGIPRWLQVHQGTFLESGPFSAIETSHRWPPDNIRSKKYLGTGKPVSLPAVTWHGTALLDHWLLLPNTACWQHRKGSIHISPHIWWNINRQGCVHFRTYTVYSIHICKTNNSIMDSQFTILIQHSFVKYVRQSMKPICSFALPCSSQHWPSLICLSFL